MKEPVLNLLFYSRMPTRDISFYNLFGYYVCFPMHAIIYSNYKLSHS